MNLGEYDAQGIDASDQGANSDAYNRQMSEREELFKGSRSEPAPIISSNPFDDKWSEKSDDGIDVPPLVRVDAKGDFG